MSQRVLTGHENLLGPDHLSTLHQVYNLGALYRRQSKSTEAESMFQRSLTGFEKVAGPDDEMTLSTLQYWGILQRQKGMLAEAERSFLRVLRGYIRNPPPNREEPHRLFYNMGMLYQDMQDFEKAKTFFSQACQERRELLGSEHFEMIGTSSALSELDEEIERRKHRRRS